MCFFPVIAPIFHPAPLSLTLATSCVLMGQFHEDEASAELNGESVLLLLLLLLLPVSAPSPSLRNEGESQCSQKKHHGATMAALFLRAIYTIKNNNYNNSKRIQHGLHEEWDLFVNKKYLSCAD